MDSERPASPECRGRLGGRRSGRVDVVREHDVGRDRSTDGEGSGHVSAAQRKRQAGLSRREAPPLQRRDQLELPPARQISSESRGRMVASRKRAISVGRNERDRLDWRTVDALVDELSSHRGHAP